ncbi:MAG: NPCBM/NEW2 domain-containing protein [Thermoguttaceae bacterium]
MAVPIDGPPFVAQLTSIDKGRLTFQADNGIKGASPIFVDTKIGTVPEKRQLALNDLVLWGACRTPKRTPILIFPNGGLILAQAITFDEKSISAETRLFGRLKLARSALAGIVLQFPAPTKERDALVDRIAQRIAKSDCLLFENNDEQAGSLENLSQSDIKFRSDIGSLNVDLERVTAIIFRRVADRKTSDNQAACWLVTNDGSRLLASNPHMDSNTLRFVADGQDFSTAPSNLVFLQTFSDRVAYLSDLKATTYTFTPYLSLQWPYQCDHDVTGAWLRHNGHLYIKGIGMHSAARLAYDLAKPYKRFQAELAVDDSAGGAGSVIFKILVDGQEKFISKIIRGRMKPTAVSIDLMGAKRLELFVDYADRADVLDRADWLNARLIK